MTRWKEINRYKKGGLGDILDSVYRRTSIKTPLFSPKNWAQARFFHSNEPRHYHPIHNRVSIDIVRKYMMDK